MGCIENTRAPKTKSISFDISIMNKCLKSIEILYVFRNGYVTRIAGLVFKKLFININVSDIDIKPAKELKLHYRMQIIGNKTHISAQNIIR